MNKAKLGQLLSCPEKRYTILSIPSLSLPNEVLDGIVGINHYETRSMWSVLRAMNPGTNVLFVTSEKINANSIDHLLNLLPNSEEVRDRIKFFHLENKKLSTNRNSSSLARRVLDCPEILEEIKNQIDPETTYLDPFLSTEVEEKLGEYFGIPVLGVSPEFKYFQGKSGNKKIFNDCLVPHAQGLSDINSLEQLYTAIETLWSENPHCQKMVLKLNEGVSGNGNAILRLPIAFSEFLAYSSLERKIFLKACLELLEFQSKVLDWESYCAQIPKGMIIEVWLDGKKKYSPSCQGVISPKGKVEILSTHEQILDQAGQTYLGCIFPAKWDYRQKIQSYTMRIGKEMAKKGIIGPYAVDFMVVDGNIFAIEINLRQGGTTHPYQLAKHLTSSRFDYRTGTLRTEGNQKIYYQSNDNWLDEKLKGKAISSLLDFMVQNHVTYNPLLKSGVIFHMLGTMKENGKIGFTVIGASYSHVESLKKNCEELLRKFVSQQSEEFFVA